VTKSPLLTRIVLFAACVCAVVAVPAAFAAKGGKGNGNNATAVATGTFNGLVLLSPTTDGLPHWDHAITFNVTSTAQYYFVRVDCYQGGTLVYEKSNGFTGSWMTDYGLNGPGWTGGAADCTAVLYSQNWDGSNQETLATMGFHVYA
jgi:hypothetical protein